MEIGGRSVTLYWTIEWFSNHRLCVEIFSHFFEADGHEKLFCRFEHALRCVALLDHNILDVKFWNAWIGGSEIHDAVPLLGPHVACNVI